MINTRYDLGLCLTGLFIASMTLGAVSAKSFDFPDCYNVVWDCQSTDSSESMPVGGGDIGLNVWVENGELLFYMMRSGCFDENNEFLKLGRVRIKLSPNPFSPGGEFKQELRLKQSCIEITGKGENGVGARIKVWVEVHRPVIHVDIRSTSPVSVEAAYEGWRNKDYELIDDGKNSRFGCFGYDCYPGKVLRYRDTVEHGDDSVMWHHRNRNENLIFDVAVLQQGLEADKDKMWNPLKNRTFGGILAGKSMNAAGTAEGEYIITPFKSWKLKSESPSKSHSIKVLLHTSQAETLDQWKSDLNELTNAKTPTDKQAWNKNRKWWNEFWGRSFLVINGDGNDPTNKPWQLGRNYQLFRYQLGCNAYGDYPTKFNGGLFTYDPSLVSDRRRHSPDWRAWGGGSFTAQNQRLVYWPMLKCGDFEMMIPQFEFYRRPLENATLRVKTYWGHEGCLFTEQMSQFGLPIASAWGWCSNARCRRREPETERGVQVNGACRYHYESQLEFSYMILEYQRFTGADIGAYMPFIERSVKFFDEHYQMRHQKRTGRPLDGNGKLLIYPSTSCESYGGALNPTDLIGGLNACLKSLIRLPEKYCTEEKRKYWREFLDRIPYYGIGQVQNDKIFKPAWSWARYQNCECPQFYPLFPFNEFTLNDPEIQWFRNTWQHGEFAKGLVKSWHQDGIFFARMRMTAEAAEYNTKKMEDCGRRFPSFWGPGHDWVPDHNWGGSGMIGLQEMLMQTFEEKIYILPAWPANWNADFKLHAPHKTVVEAVIRNGSIEKLKVTPKERRKDVVVLN